MKPVAPVKMPISCLVVDEIVTLDWSWFKGFNVVNIGTPKDGSCFFHSVLGALSSGYRNRTIGGEPIRREQLVKNARIDFGHKLKEEYTRLSRGTLVHTSESIPDVKLKNLLQQLVDGKTISYVFFELVANSFNIDIYVLNKATQDIYILGDDDIYRKDRQAIVLMYIPIPIAGPGTDEEKDRKRIDHYEYVGLRAPNGVIYTIFESTNEFIRLIRDRELATSATS